MSVTPIGAQHKFNLQQHCHLHEPSNHNTIPCAEIHSNQKQKSLYQISFNKRKHIDAMLFAIGSIKSQIIHTIFT